MENINKLNIYIGKVESQRLKNIDDVENGTLDVEELDELIGGLQSSRPTGGLLPSESCGRLLRRSLPSGVKKNCTNKFIRKYGLSIYKK